MPATGATEKKIATDIAEAVVASEKAAEIVKTTMSNPPLIALSLASAGVGVVLTMGVRWGIKKYKARKDVKEVIEVVVPE